MCDPRPFIGTDRWTQYAKWFVAQRKTRPDLRIESYEAYPSEKLVVVRFDYKNVHPCEKREPEP
jgi:hypothetical protein